MRNEYIKLLRWKKRVAKTAKITLAFSSVLFLASMIFQMKTEMFENGLWASIPFAIMAISVAVLMTFDE